MALTSYDISNGDAQSTAITVSNGYLNMEIDATSISDFITVKLEHSPDGGTDWFPLKDSEGRLLKKVLRGTKKIDWQVGNIEAVSVRQNLHIGSGKTGTIVITDNTGV